MAIFREMTLTAPERMRVLIGSVMDTDDLEIRDNDGEHQHALENGLPVWPWLVLLALLAIGIGVIGPLVG